jgi:GH24 family phage-related lysozyme (muramidase)
MVIHLVKKINFSRISRGTRRSSAQMVRFGIMATYLDQSLAKLEWFEGSIPWMYLDTRGNVTVGVGLMLPDVAAAQKLPFVMDTQPATEGEITAEFARVAAMPMGRPALFYRHDNAPELPRTEIDSLLRTVLLGFETELRVALPGYDGFADSVKLALLDMAYNLGPASLLHGYPNLIRAVNAGNWAQAAAQCFRHGPGAARNQWTQQMFLQNVVGAIKAEGDSRVKNIAFGLLGMSASAVEWMRRKR